MAAPPDGQQLRAQPEQHRVPKPMGRVGPSDVLLTRSPALVIVGDRREPADAGPCIEYRADAT
jgi:hypothetical protein